VALVLGSALLYVAPASTNVGRAPVDERPDMGANAAIRPWSDYLSEEAVESGGIQNDLDGNASSLFASDQWCGLPACRDPRQP